MPRLLWHRLRFLFDSLRSAFRSAPGFPTVGVPVRNLTVGFANFP
jgi:hypothetical protein